MRAAFTGLFEEDKQSLQGRLVIMCTDQYVHGKEMGLLYKIQCGMPVDKFYVKSVDLYRKVTCL